MSMQAVDVSMCVLSIELQVPPQSPPSYLFIASKRETEDARKRCANWRNHIHQFGQPPTLPQHHFREKAFTRHLFFLFFLNQEYGECLMLYSCREKGTFGALVISLAYD